VGPPGIICNPPGFPLIGVTFPISDGHTQSDFPTLSQPEPGTLCLSGPAPLPGSRPRFPLIFRDPYPHHVELGIAKISFTIDSPPPAGVIVRGAQSNGRMDDVCAVSPLACIDVGAELPPITKPGPVLADLTDFKQQDPESPLQDYNAAVFIGLEFAVYEGDYSFCLRDMKFLDADGKEVVAP
jgi:hypothetical protein